MTTEQKETAAAFALSRIYQYQARIPRTIVEHLGNASAIFELDNDGLDEAIGPFNKHKDAILKKTLEQWHDELVRSIPSGWQYLPFFHNAFPRALWVCEDSPMGLFYQGCSSPEEIFSRPCISIVGTRDMSSYGAQWCRKLTSSLAQTQQKPTIVSGLAFGVDITAQTSAMEYGLPTIAVLGTGAGKIYPCQHEYYASRIAQSTNCALVTENPPDDMTSANSFLCRNRIIAGLSSATVLVESRQKGGGITTAQIASSYSRDVFAVPGRCDDTRSQGCNMLIHSHIAEPIFDCDSFLKALDFKPLSERSKLIGTAMAAAGLYDGGRTGVDGEGDSGRASIGGSSGKNGGRSGIGGKLSDNLTKLVLAIRKNRDADAAELAAITKLPLEDVLAGTVVLENDDIIQSDILGRFSIKKD